MTKGRDRPGSRASDRDGPRAILRVPEVLMAIAAFPDGCSLAALGPRLDVPKTSLHRLLRTLESGGYLTLRNGTYRLGPTSHRLARMIGRHPGSAALPESARPVLEGLALETGETVMLGVLTEDDAQIRYLDVIDSRAPVRFTVPVGDLRPLHSAASGKAVLPFLAADARAAYLAGAAFEAFTPFTTGREELAAMLAGIGERAVAFDRDGRVVGASGIASPFFGADGKVRGSVSVAGPTDRVLAHREQLEALVRQAGERISRALGYDAAYPPRP